MATYFTLAVDCNQNESVARELESRFTDLTVRIPLDEESFSDIGCSVRVYRSRRSWAENESEKADSDDRLMVNVGPDGVYLGGERSDLVCQDNMMTIRNAFYDVLRGDPDRPTVHGYRSAIFGVEVQERLGGGEWDRQLECLFATAQLTKYDRGLILSSALIQNESLRKQQQPFSEGYLWYDHAMFWPFPS